MQWSLHIHVFFYRFVGYYVFLLCRHGTQVWSSRNDAAVAAAVPISRPRILRLVAAQPRFEYAGVYTSNMFAMNTLATEAHEKRKSQ